jgi:hypothetical protein
MGLRDACWNVGKVVLKIEEALGDAAEIGKIVGRQDLALDNRETGLDLVEPTGMNWGMHEHRTGIADA